MTKRRSWFSRPVAVEVVGAVALGEAIILMAQDFFGFTFIGEGGPPAYPSGGTVMVLGLLGILAFSVADCLRYLESRLPSDKPADDHQSVDR